MAKNQPANRNTTNPNREPNSGGGGPVLPADPLTAPPTPGSGNAAAEPGEVIVGTLVTTNGQPAGGIQIAPGDPPAAPISETAAAMKADARDAKSASAGLPCGVKLITVTFAVYTGDTASQFATRHVDTQLSGQGGRALKRIQKAKEAIATAAAGGEHLPQSHKSIGAMTVVKSIFDEIAAELAKQGVTV